MSNTENDMVTAIAVVKALAFPMWTAMAFVTRRKLPVAQTGACNYDASATDDDMSCELPGDSADMNANTENDMVTADCGCEGTCISDGTAMAFATKSSRGCTTPRNTMPLPTTT